MLELVKSHWGASLVVIVALLLAGAAFVSQSKKVSPLAWNWFGPVNASNGVAVGGYDAVAYHNETAARIGSAEFSTSWSGADWRFASAENLAAFKSDPKKYAPQFGGFCSFATSKGFTALGDQTIWHVEDGQLYLFADEGPKKSWVSEIDDGVISRSDKNWRTRTAKYD